MLLFAALLLADELHDATSRQDGRQDGDRPAPAPAAMSILAGQRLEAIAERLENLASRLEA